ncbi:MAG: type II toxin-antitoxin system death-on-curing family toxin [Bryobacterales bacterium]
MSEDLGWEWVDFNEVIRLYAMGIDEYGGTPSAPRDGCVEGSLGNAEAAALYHDEEAPDLLLAAAYLLVYLAKNHCFVDGNKRVAWMAAIRVLDLNGIRVIAEQREAAELVNAVASGTVDVRQVHAWLNSPGRIAAAANW